MTENRRPEDPPELPDTINEVADVEAAHTLELEDGSRYEMSGMYVLAVYMKHGRDEWPRWRAAARDKIADAWHENEVPQKFGTRPVQYTDGEECMADIAEDVLYYGDLRAALLQCAFNLLAAEDGEEPVQVVGITGDGTRGYDDD